MRNAVLHVYLIDVDVGLNAERDSQLLTAVVRIGGLHVEHVVHTVHLLLERCGDRLLNRDRVRSRVVCRDDDLRRHNVRELRQRQTQHRDKTAHDSDDRDHHCDDRAPDEEVGNHDLKCVQL